MWWKFRNSRLSGPISLLHIYPKPLNFSRAQRMAILLLLLHISSGLGSCSSKRMENEMFKAPETPKAQN
jgi:hypothetical protein